VSAGVGFNRTVLTDDAGHYTLDHVPVGPFSLQTRFPDLITDAEFGSASGQLTAAGQTLTVDIPVAAQGALSGTVFGSDGAAVPFASIRIEAFGSSGPLGDFVASGLTSDLNGRYLVPRVPVGPVQVTVQDPLTGRLGLATGTLTATGLTLDVTLGDAARLPLNLDGADGFRYDVQGDGDLNDGGTVSRSLNDAYDGAYRLAVNGVSFQFNSSVAALDLDGRQASLGPAASGSLQVTRKIFVPAAGGFARYLEVLSNPTGAAIQVTVHVSSNLGSDSNTRIVVSPSSTNNTFAVTDQSGFCCDPVLGHVFSGANPPVPVTVFFQDGNDAPVYDWTVTVPANSTVILMHFALQRAISDAAGAQAAAQALSDLSDPNALAGLTAAEKASIVNFVVPQ
jgi:hypothetical protein